MADILVVAVHPDDESLGCGGTLLRHKSQGDNIHWLIITSMYYLDDNNKKCTVGIDLKKHVISDYFKSVYNQELFSKEAVNKKAKTLAKVDNDYGFKTVTELRVPTTTVSSQDEVLMINLVGSALSETRPDTIFIPYHHDVHGDHRSISPIINSCIKTFRSPFIKNVYMMETLSETEYAASISGGFIPNHFVCIDRFFDKKMEILANYQDEIFEHPFPRSETAVRSQCQIRGTMANCQFAEAFMVVKEIVR